MEVVEGSADPLSAIAGSLAAAGLFLRGGFRPAPADEVPRRADGAASATVLLVGSVGPSLWPAFSGAPEYRDGQPHPLDRWTRRVIEPIAAAYRATALYPFSGPPWLPFQRWAQRAEAVFPSPLGLLIHPVHGLWHAYRAALSFADALVLPARTEGVSPCAACWGRPCLSRCPVAAVTQRGLDAAACRDHLGSGGGDDCLAAACLARAACPVGSSARYPQDEARFHMAAFRGPIRPSAGEDS